MDKQLVETGILNEYQKLRMSLSVLKHLNRKNTNIDESSKTNKNNVTKLIETLEQYFN